MKEQLRNRILERDDYECQYCGVDYSGNPTSLNVVPKGPVSETNDDPLGNLETRCDTCARRPETPDHIPSDDADSRLLRLLDALESAKTKQMFGDDGLRIVTIAIAIPPLLFTAIGIGVESRNVQALSLVNNAYLVIGFFTWIGTLLVAILAYYYSRVSGSNPTVIERLFEVDKSELASEESVLTNQVEMSYRRNAALIALSIVLLAITVVLFAMGYMKALDISI